jgi:hypothetical protein
VDLERRVVVDVLADRSAATAANWFRDHPDVEMVSRERAGLYAEAAREGTPQAKQAADRFHLLQNFRETIERQLGGYEAPIRECQIKAIDNHAAAPVPAQSDCASDAVTLTRFMPANARQPGKNSSMRSGLCLKEAVPSGRLPASSVLVAAESNAGSAGSICRTATRWRQLLPTRHILAFCWSGGGPKA